MGRFAAIDRNVSPTVGAGRRSLCRPVDADPSQVAFAFAESVDSAILLGGSEFGEIGRFDLIADEPRGVFEADENGWRLTDDWPGPRPDASFGADEALRFLFRATALPNSESLPTTGETVDLPFVGGWIGFVGYDFAPQWEPVPRRLAVANRLPDLRFAYYDVFAIRDRVANSLTVVGVDAFGEGDTRLGERVRDAEVRLRRPLAPDDGGPLVLGSPVSDFEPAEYVGAVERVLAYLKAGDLFQANLSQRFSAPWIGEASVAFRRLRRRCPTPFSAFLRGQDWSIACGSPERFLLLEPNGQVETRPIKGTRPRGTNPRRDASLRDELLRSPKDRAELAMIVDVERNDLGRVCELGSVDVVRHAAIESFGNVHHLVSTIRGRLRPECDLVDLLRATFPSGSISGAPKIRAMEIIDELERSRRGIYTGSIGYVSDHGRADFDIAIRTAYFDSGHSHYHVGGGIVIDSDPVAEYEETLTKGAALRQALMGS